MGVGLLAALSACGGSRNALTQGDAGAVIAQDDGTHGGPATRPTGKLGDLFSKSTDPNTSVRVNKYIWNAALDVLNFLPVESVDPFTGVIVTGYGTPPGGGRAYRATIYVQDPALDARSLNIAMESKGGGAVSVETVRAIEDAILTRARELRIQDSKL
ncbi:MAG: DUF3576 domain-containing protein [Rhodobacteraceae bacterium]|nr:DUF3576 domain-containing protein [Paracoccaceae bacterium]